MTVSGQGRRRRRISYDDIAAAAKQWAADHQDGTVEDALADLDLTGNQDATVIIRGVLARAEWDREGTHARRQAGYEP
jgi:hypothetical protein